MIFAVICMIFGIVFYGYIIASVAAGLANADAQRARYQERLDAIKTFLKVSGNKIQVVTSSNGKGRVVLSSLTCSKVRYIVRWVARK